LLDILCLTRHSARHVFMAQVVAVISITNPPQTGSMPFLTGKKVHNSYD